MLITSINGAANSWVDGLMVGVEMNVRAAIVIVGFSVLGTELYNPVIRDFLAKSAYRQVGLALELAFESLPYVVGHLPSAKTFLTQPATIIQLLINNAEYRFNEVNQKQNAPVFIFSGGVADGKTTFLTNLVEALKKDGKTLAGFISPRILHGTETVGYQIKNVATNECFTLLQVNNNLDASSSKTIGRFKIDISAQKEAKSILINAMKSGSEVIVIDEVGRLELRGEGWNNELRILAQQNNTCLILAVRDVFVQEVITTFGFNNSQIVRVKDARVEIVKKQILDCR
jgi:nucleoside-triphosphatase THEP1